MRSRRFLAWALVFGLTLTVRQPLFADTPYPHVAPTEPNSPQDELKTFKVPQGFEVQLVASEPDIRKPIQIAFDAKGRLWATTSEEYPFPAVGRPGKDRLYVLEDFGSDGKAKKVSIFADDLNIPIGVLPLPDCKSVIVSSIDPGEGNNAQPVCWIWKLTDTDGDGKCDKKEKLYGPFGCRDTHGMNNSYTLMPDGWVYACHGYSNDSHPKGKDGHEISMNSGNTFRFRPDGSRIEIWTRGQVNPFGIAIDPYFNIYTADCHSKPITQLIHGATYQSFGKLHDGLGFAQHVTIHGHDSTALCGLVYYAADQFPKEYLDHMFLGNVTSNCINWDKIDFKGSTPVATDKGMFLSSKDYWFRPTDVKLGPDGALYFADFYNKIIGHYEVDLKHPARDKLRGRLWRIVWKGTDGKGVLPAIQDLTKLDIKTLRDHLGDANFAVRMAATNQLIMRHEENSQYTKKVIAEKLIVSKDWQQQTEGRVHLLWAAMVSDPNPNIGKAFGKGSTPQMRVHSLHIAATFPSWENKGEPAEGLHGLRKQVVEVLNGDEPFVQRAAVEALIQHPDARNVRPLLQLLKIVPSADNQLAMATRIALRESLRSVDDWNSAAGATGWTPAELASLGQILPAVPTAGAATFISKNLDALAADQGRLPIYVEHAARYSKDKACTDALIAFASNQEKDNLRRSILVLHAYNQGVLKRGSNLNSDAVATKLAEQLTAKAIESTDPQVTQAGVDLASSLKLASAFDSLVKLAENKSRNEAQRAAALPGLLGINAQRAAPLILKLLGDASESIAVREKAAQVLAGSNRGDAQDELVKILQVSPARLQSTIALAMASNGGAAEKLLKAIADGKASGRLLQDKAIQTKLRESRVPKANERITALTKGLPSADQKLTQLMKLRSEGFNKAKPDPVLGKQIFTKNCAICHQIGNEGVKIGPQLDGIGGRGLDRLLEDVLDPNRNVDVTFRQTTLILKDGKTVPGLVLREEGQIVVMADDKGKEMRIAKNDIDERRTSILSPMPANVSEIVAEKDFYDLMAYLLTQRAKGK